MALIRCLECGNEISDKSKMCIHCGYPLENEHRTICKINGIPVDFTEVQNILGDENYSHDSIYIAVDKILNKSFPTLTKTTCRLITNQIVAMKAIPETWNAEFDLMLDRSTPKCPKCGSTSISTGARGVNWTLGFIGASKTVNRCANCGHMWKPKR